MRYRVTVKVRAGHVMTVEAGNAEAARDLAIDLCTDGNYTTWEIDDTHAEQVTDDVPLSAEFVCFQQAIARFGGLKGRDD